MDTTFILNFGHPLAPKVLEELQPCQEIRLGLRIGMFRNPERQVQEAMDEAARVLNEHGGALDGSVPTLVVLPGFSEGAVLLVAAFAGRTGSLPRVLSLRRQEDGTFDRWGYNDGRMWVRIPHLDLERVKTKARGKRPHEKSIGQR